MLAVRVIPCLDIKDGRVVKGVNFLNLVDAGDPVENATFYADQGADEITFLDITASVEKRKIVRHLVEQIAEHIFIPFSVGGGIRNVDDVENILMGGADKVSINTAAFLNPNLLYESAKIFGSQCVICAIDAKWNPEMNDYEVYLNGGRTPTGASAIEWAKKAEEHGAGEILLTSMDADGTQNGYDISLLRKVVEVTTIPVIASGGAGKLHHFVDAVLQGKASAVLAASIFHFRTFTIKEVKEEMRKHQIPVRL
ncbi:MAG: imidazole glycerol phosphate synthase subunit HisF [Leptospiraceae bacterium]|nr:imidazole glycerol phosphate synthase subunit HisF [Leptospiraceae bacterium]MDW7976400.1 imidazole glycerol phosphate synthase subunit HisF [Leptospiraceae bacterium]